MAAWIDRLRLSKRGPTSGSIPVILATSGNEALARRASDALYHVTTATLLAREGAQLGAMGEDARRLILARMVIDHRLRPQDPLGIPSEEDPMVVAVLSQGKVTLKQAHALAAG